jgi:hypothetical protein
MAAQVLAPERVAELQRAPFTYEPVGATCARGAAGLQVVPPQSAPGSTRLRLRGRGPDDLAGSRASRAEPSRHPRVELMRTWSSGLGLAAVAIQALCRIVYILDEPRRRGFAYGTPPGHPESGEELFVLELGMDDQLTFTIAAYSHHASAVAKIGGPLTRRVQQAMTAGGIPVTPCRSQSKLGRPSPQLSSTPTATARDRLGLLHPGRRRFADALHERKRSTPPKPHGVRENARPRARTL